MASAGDWALAWGRHRGDFPACFSGGTAIPTAAQRAVGSVRRAGSPGVGPPSGPWSLGFPDGVFPSGFGFLALKSSCCSWTANHETTKRFCTALLPALGGGTSLTPRACPRGQAQVLTEGGWLSRVSGRPVSVEGSRWAKSEPAPLEPGGVTPAWKGNAMVILP